MSILTIVQIILFIGVSVFFIVFSLPYLKDPSKHGFYRFFGWELTLFLVVINMRMWFDDPFSPRQIASWFLLLVAIFLVGMGFLQLSSFGKPKGFFENTTKLVESGLYKFIRHPLVFLPDPGHLGSCPEKSGPAQRDRCHGGHDLLLLHCQG